MKNILKIKSFFESINLYKKFKRNTENEIAIGFFVYKIKQKARLIFWKNFPSITLRKINRNVISQINNKQFSKNITERFDLYNLKNFEHINKKEIEKIISSADQSISNVYQLLGSNQTILKPMNWHIDFKTGHYWKPQIFFTNYIQESIKSNSDVKVPRELSRCHHFLHLALAYKITNDNKYSNKIIEQIIDWIDENPLMFSINWGCTMDVAIRASNWIWALNLTKDYWNTEVSNLEKIKNSLYQHGWFIFRNLEKEPYNNHNHYLADLAGLIQLGVLFKETIEGKKWLDAGIKELFKEIRSQILPSGMSYERSTNYNRLVLELILTPILVLKNIDIEIPQDIWFRIEKMFEFICYSLKPNGHSPIIGDQDNGRLLPFGIEDQTDYSYLIALGTILFKRSDFKYYSKGYNIYCLMLAGQNSYLEYEKTEIQKNELVSKGFPDIGLYIMRKENNYLVFNCSGKGMNPEIGKFTGTHTHSDLLSFELVSNGKTFLVDPGSFVYTANATERFNFRSTFMHNTVSIDGLSQDNVQLNMLWDFERNAIPKVLNWESNTKFDRVIAQHNGFERFHNPITHQREICFSKETKVWEIFDSFKGIGEHSYAWHFHFDVGIDFEIIENSVITKCDDTNLKISFISEQPLQLNKINSFVSKSYGIKEASKSLKLTYSGKILPEVKTIIQSI